MSLGEAWRTLGIARTADTAAIRRAYAARLKALDLDRDAQAYADLRSAREVALRWAANQSAPVEAEASGKEVAADAPPADPQTGSAWPYGAPVVPGLVADPAVVTALGDALAAPYSDLAPRPAASGELRDLPLPVGDPFARPVLPRPPEAGQELIQPDRGRDVAFYDLLFPGGEPSGEPLDPQQAAAAQGHFRAVLRQAQNGALSLYEATDTWLADTLARAWPRSSPFVPAAVAAFGWERQAGQLGERPAVAYLNARAKGMSFHEKVLDPGHVLHKAWVELCRPGRAGALHRMMVGKTQVEQLIVGVRQRFPELEHYWDPQRVASWEGAAANANTSEGPGLWVWVLIGVGALQLLGGLARTVPSDVARQPDPIALVDGLAPDRAELANEAVRQAFGEETTLAQVEALNPELAGTFRANLPGGSFEPTAEASATYKTRMVNLVRERVYRTAQATDGPELVFAMRFRLAHLIAARKIDAQACMNLVRLAELDGEAWLSPATIASEQKFALRLLRDGRLGAPGTREPTRATIPGAMVKEIIDETGLPLATVDKALDHEGSDAALCAVRIALLRAALQSQGTQRAEILHIL